MDDKPTQDLATRAFQKRVLDEFAAVRAKQAEMHAEQAEMRAEQAEMRAEQAEMRKDISELRSQQTAMARNVAALDQRLMSVEKRLVSLEDKVDLRLKETRPIWEAVQQQLRRLDKKFDQMVKELFELRGDVSASDKRIDDLEHRILAS